MKKLFAIFIVLNIIISAQAQNNTAAFVHFKGEGVYKRGNKQQKLDFPMLFNSGDKIQINSGEAVILLANGEEANLSPQKEYTVPKIKKSEMIVEFDASVFQDFVAQSQSNSSITVRGDSLNLILYPISSKLTNKKRSEIIWQFTDGNSSFDFEIYDSNTFDLLFSKKKFKGNSLNLNEIELLAGNDYTWNLKIVNTKAEQLGLISVVDEDEINKLPKADLTNKLSVVKVYQYYVKNEYYFDAYNLMKKANEKYPNISLFSYILDNIKGLGK